MDLFNDDLNLSFNNFDSEDIQTDETINAVFIVDESPSISNYVKDLNFAFNDFVQSMQNSNHIKDKLFVSVVGFDENVRVKSGFQPISGVPVTTFKPQGGGTALYDAVNVGLKNAVEYRETLENTGINVKTLIFVITDGEDNSSSTRPGNIKNALESIMSKEQNAFSFVTILFGVGDSRSFRLAKDKMGFQHLAQVGATGKDIKKMISFISSSISKSSSGSNPVDINF